MQMNDKVLTALEVLKDCAENEFERHRIDVLIQDLTDPPKVEQIDGTHQKFNGRVYCRNKGGHYIKGNSIHQAVYHYYCGEIPAGYVVHHKDGNKANNDVSNLQMLSRDEHSKIHYPEGTPVVNCPQRNLICPVCGKTFETVSPVKVFCSHKCMMINYEQNHKTIKICEFCGKEFAAHYPHLNARFCSNECAQQARRKIVKRTCPICGKEFVTRSSSDGGNPSETCSKQCAVKLGWQRRKSNHSFACLDNAPSSC
jgi:endogenous inhibitor of DNA gyrase (YacG/DUF329 family)